MRVKEWLLRGLLLASLGLSAQVQAVCSVVASVPASFGTTVSSMTVRTTSQPSSTTNAGFSCTPALLSVLASNDHFYATVSGSPQGGLVGPTGDVINYTIYANNTTAFPMTRGTAFDFGGSGGIAASLGLVFGPGTKVVPLYFATTLGSNVASGCTAKP